MFDMLQNIFLNPWLIFFLLFITFLIITRIAIGLKEYPGYALGVLIGVFFMLVYISLQGEPAPITEGVRQTLNIYEVFGSTFLGLMFGAIIMLGLYFGSTISRGISLQVASYTAIILILLFLTAFSGPITQRMIGIFAVSIGIASLLGLVLFPDIVNKMQMPAGLKQRPGDTGPVGSDSKQVPRIVEIRQKMDNNNR